MIQYKILNRMNDETASTIMAALSRLTQPHLATLTHSLSTDILRRHRRLSAVLSSPTLFSLTLHRLRLLSLPAKTSLIAKHLLSSLRRLTSSSAAAELRPRDLDAVALLLLLCDARRLLDAPAASWRELLSKHYADHVLTAGMIGSPATILYYVEEVARCMRFVAAEQAQSGGLKVAAAVAAVVALPSVEVSCGGGGECAICKDEMREGRDVCLLPCKHMFHWKCVLTWLRNNNTCPCCRFQLPTDHIFGEVRRLWGLLVRTAGLDKDSFV